MVNDNDDNVVANLSRSAKDDLRIARFFLPVLGRAGLAQEIESEKARLRHESDSRLNRIRVTCDEEKRKLRREREECVSRSLQRIAEIRQEGETRVSEEARLLHPALSQLERRKIGHGLGGLFAAMALLGFISSGGFGLGAMVSAVAILVFGLGYLFSSHGVAAVKRGLESGAARIRHEVEAAVGKEDTLEVSRLAESTQGLMVLGATASRDISKENASLSASLTRLNVQLDYLVELYELSVASEDEVLALCSDRLLELQRSVASQLGLDPDDILDERSAEIWAPSFLQAQEFPQPVLLDASQSANEFFERAEEIVSPMRPAVPNDEQWWAFSKRIVLLLGLKRRAPIVGEEQIDGDQESMYSGRSPLNCLNAVRFSPERRTYLAGNFFYQRIVCTDDLIGIYRAYVNVLNRRIPHTSSLLILYKDVVSIGIETSLSRERFSYSGMTIDQHTHTLTLELTSGNSYCMSGDAGSVAQIESSPDLEAQSVVSIANKDFRAQVRNIRALIRDAKST